MTAESGRRKLTVGILGGMGPEATVDLQRRIIELTPATGDGDHIRMLVDCDPSVPSRIAAIIEGSGPSPAPALIAMARDWSPRVRIFSACPVIPRTTIFTTSRAKARCP